MVYGPQKGTRKEAGEILVDWKAYYAEEIVPVKVIDCPPER